MESFKELFNLEYQLSEVKKIYSTIKVNKDETYYKWMKEKIFSFGSKDVDDHEAWLFERSLGIGGSDIGALLGISPYRTKFNLWQDKCLGIRDFNGNNFTKWGALLEEVIGNNFANMFGLNIVQSPPASEGIIGGSLWMKYNIDIDIPNSEMMAEVKTGAAEAKDKWGPGIERDHIGIYDNNSKISDNNNLAVHDIKDCNFPLDYFCQCQYYMMMMKKNYCFLTALIGGNDERTYLIKSNVKFQEFIYYSVANFMFLNVIDKMEPLKTPLEMMMDLVAYDHSGEVQLDEVDGLDKKLKEYYKITQMEKKVSKVRSSLEEDIKLHIGERTSICREGETFATWKGQTRTSIDKDALEELYPEVYEELKRETVSRVLRLNKKQFEEVGNEKERSGI